VLFARELGVSALTAGVLAGFILQALVLIWGNRDLLRRSLRPALALRHPDFTGSASHILPLLVGSAGSVTTGLVNQYFLSQGGEGAISAMAYAAMFAFLPVEVFAQAVVTTFYPALGRHFARAEFKAAADSFADGVRFVLFLTLPCAVLLAVFAEPVMVVLLERGSFLPSDTQITARLVALLTLGMVFRAVAYFNYRVLHAAVRPWLQVAIGLLGVVTHVLLCQLWVDSRGTEGVAMATSLSMLQSALLSLGAAAWVLRMRWHGGLARELLRLLLIAAPMLAAAVWVSSATWPPEMTSSRFASALLALCGAAIVGLLTLGLATWIGQRDLHWLRNRLLRRRPDQHTDGT
jgi:putative peptidoglycan lipid II flippase